ncbi:hypothetical protein EGR_02485 [Echinococcus granulosus]|uniref:Uncharacterized protein n=1 Tax=Echinococcus granulosus TaxID=6210 RepID=W6V864_ECHGR|nr:hypothetical protein EGR_02485 [Echinococcus granulosus]EUB62689.1 hypothetical protein EGR_02485 [Echinococcus granulosus]
MHGLAASEILLKQTLNAYKSVNCYSLSEENDEEYENPSDVEIIRLMVKDPQSAPIIQSRILCILHNIPARTFRTFEVKTFGIEPVAVLPHFEPNEDEARLIELLHQLTRLCTYLACSAMKLRCISCCHTMRMASFLDDLLEDHPELVPPLMDIWYFAEVSQLNGLISVTEYLDRNDKPDQLSDQTGHYDAMYETNRAFLDSRAISSPSLSPISLSSTGSLNTLYMFNTARNLSDTSCDCSVSGSSITFGVESAVEGVEPLDAKTARRIALAILSRIARLLDIGLDELLTALLPLSSASFGTPQSSPRCERLVEWGRMVHANLTQMDEKGFVEGIPVSRVVESSALAYLRALADWPTKANRVQLLEESIAVMDDFLITASTGFPILQSQQSKKQHHFLRLVEFILCRFNLSHLHLTASRPSEEPRAPKENVGLGHDQFLPVDTTIPFIDESCLAFNTTSDDPPLVENCNLSSLLEQSPPNAPKVAPLSVKIPVVSHCSAGGTFTPISPPLLRCGCADSAAAAIAIQTALLFIPPELRFQLQLFVEQAQEVTANAERHIRPEKTLHYVQPKVIDDLYLFLSSNLQLAKWFAPRFFAFSTNLTKSSGHHLLEYILSFPQSLRLLKPPPSCLDLGIEGWANRFPELEPQSPRLDMGRAADRRPNFDIVSSPAAANHEENESVVVAGSGGGESGQVSPISCPVDAETASSATNVESMWDQRTVRNCHLPYLSPPIFFFHFIDIAADVQCTVTLGPRQVTRVESLDYWLQGSLDLKHVLTLGNMRHLIHTLNFFIDDKHMDPKTKMRYIKQFEATHPDVFWLRFGDSQTAKNYYAHLHRRIDESRGGPCRGQSHTRLVGRFAEIFRLRNHFRTKKQSHQL